MITIFLKCEKFINSQIIRYIFYSAINTIVDRGILQQTFVLVAAVGSDVLHLFLTNQNTTRNTTQNTT